MQVRNSMTDYNEKLFGRQMLATSLAAENNGAISLSLNPAIPHPILVT